MPRRLKISKQKAFKKKFKPRRNQNIAAITMQRITTLKSTEYINSVYSPYHIINAETVANNVKSHKCFQL